MGYDIPAYPVSTVSPFILISRPLNYSITYVRFGTEVLLAPRHAPDGCAGEACNRCMCRLGYVGISEVGGTLVCHNGLL